MLNLPGAQIDLTSTDFIVVRFCGYTHFFKLSSAEASIFRALEVARLTELQELSAKSDGGMRGVETKRRKKAALVMAAGAGN